MMSACIEKVIRLTAYNNEEKNQWFSGGCSGIISKFWMCINCELSSDDRAKTKRGDEGRPIRMTWPGCAGHSPPHPHTHKEQRVGQWEQMPCLDLSCAEVGEPQGHVGHWGSVLTVTVPVSLLLSYTGAVQYFVSCDSYGLWIYC